MEIALQHRLASENIVLAELYKKQGKIIFFKIFIIYLKDTYFFKQLRHRESNWLVLLYLLI